MYTYKLINILPIQLKTIYEKNTHQYIFLYVFEVSISLKIAFFFKSKHYKIKLN